jgi:hypothetical protein
MRADGRALARRQVMCVRERVIQIGDQSVQRLQPSPFRARGDLLQPLERGGRRGEMPFGLEQRAQHALQREAAFAQTVQPWTVGGHGH